MRRVAVVYDTLFTYAGGERVLEQILNAFPGCDLYAVAEVLPAGERAWLKGRPIGTSYIQNWPMLRKAFRHYAWAMPAAVEALDMTRYELVVSCCYAVSNGVLTDQGQKHLNYLVARPLKHVWDERGDFVKPPLLALKAHIAKELRQWSTIAASRPDRTLATSDHVGQWMKKRHGIAATTIYPPVDVDFFGAFGNTGTTRDHYVTTSRLQIYKKLDVLIRAFNILGRKLVIIGAGPEERYLKSLAGDGIYFAGYQTPAGVAGLVSGARAFVFAADEDFGMAMVEAHACGTPVIALARGGALEINRAPDGSVFGAFFAEQTPQSVIDAVLRFEATEELDPDALRHNAQRFATAHFIRNIRVAAEALFE